MNLAQERLVFAWHLVALFFASLIGAQRYPWLYLLVGVLAALGMLSDPSPEQPYSSALHEQRSKDFQALLEVHRWLVPCYALLGVVYAIGLASITFGVVDYRLGDNFIEFMFVLVPVGLPVLVAQQYERYQFLGAQSNQPCMDSARDVNGDVRGSCRD